MPGKNIRLLVIVLTFAPFISFAQQWQWVKEEGATGNDHSYKICSDNNGNCYIASYQGYCTLSKYNSFGNLVWAVQTNSSGAETSVCFANNRLYYVSDSNLVPLIFCYDTNGNQVWRINPGPNAILRPVITADDSGHLYITGQGGNFFQKFDTLGNLIWTRPVAANGRGICCDVAGNIYITGAFSGNTSFGSSTLSAHGNQDVFFAKYDAGGNCLWAKRAGGNYNGPLMINDNGYGIIADTLGCLYATGSFVDTADFGSFTLASPYPGSNDVFIAKYDTAGNVIWVQQANGLSDQEGHCITLDHQGNILIGGEYVPDLFFNTYQLHGWGNYDAFVAKYDTGGNFISVLSAGEAGWNDIVNGICADNSGNIFVTGNFYNTCYFGQDSVVSQSGTEIFVAKMDFTSGIINDFQTGDFLVFPDPSCGKFSLLMEGLNEKVLDIKILDVLGHIVLEKKEENIFGNGQENLDLPGAADGIYFVSVQSGRFIFTHKIIIQH